INSFERNNLQRQINEVRRQIVQQTANISGKVTADLAAKFEAAKQREEVLSAELDAQKTELMSLRDKGVGYNTLSREVETNKNLYEGLLQRLKEVGVAGGVGSNNISIVDPAILPYKKHKPNTKLNLMLGAVLGLFIGTVIAFLLEFLDDRVKSTDELERLLKLPLLGITPLIKRQNEENIALMSAESPTSALAEAFRSLRTNLLFATTEGAPHSLSITSSMPSEAKSSTCINLATTFAQSGKRILVVDADLRKPTSHKRLKLDNSQGLSNYLTGQNALDDVIQPTKIDNVFVITAGPLAPNPAELLSSDRMQALLNLAPNEYDMIIVDSPPVMGLADSLIIANRVTATLMVVAHNQSKKRAIGDAFQRLKQAHANIIGTIFTKAKSGSAYGYSYDYEYYYTYGNDQRRLSS
ncbi:MAG: polysaccharide biosynthesis tyrosine autokinase, partial [bacterium]